MKQYLIPQEGTFYKANLHCHTTMSDGKLSPEEVKQAYAEKGYSIVAYTDHEVLVPQNHLTDATFLALNGVELAITDLNNRGTGCEKTCHLCCIALEPDNHYTPYYHSSAYLWKSLEHLRPLAKRIPGSVNLDRHHTPACINAIIKTAKDAGFFVTYNHPDWSLEEKDIYANYEGMDAMEIYNHGCVVGGYLDYNPKAYDTLLRQGKKLYCLATDDNHNGSTPGTRKWDSFGGYVMIKADKLEYRTITKALQDGHFYASTGPEIKELWIADDQLHIACSEAEKIILTTYRRRRGIVWAEEGESISCADFKISPDDKYVRVTVVDHRGRTADTNAYFF